MYGGAARLTEQDAAAILSGSETAPDRPRPPHPDLSSTYASSPENSPDTETPNEGSPAGQGEERIEFEAAGQRRRLELSDREGVLGVPGLTESLLKGLLRCETPARAVDDLERAMKAENTSLEGRRVIELAAGCGVVGERLREAGAKRLLGIDPLRAGADAVQRDRPETYDWYQVCNPALPNAEADLRIKEFMPDTLVMVELFGGPILPGRALQRTVEHLPEGGWIALSLEEKRLNPEVAEDVGHVLAELELAGTLEVLSRERYVHRQRVSGDPVHHVALVARKRT